jgi:hypothetical protein
MTMHTDLPLPHAADPAIGALPLAAGTVADVFRAHDLTWTITDALRVLADVAPANPTPPRTITSPWANPAPAVDPWVRHSQPNPRRTSPRPRPAPVRPKVEQLALFD